MGFTQRKKRPHIYRDPNVPWPHETYLEKKAERAAAASDASASVVVSLPKKAAKPAKSKRAPKRK